MGLILSCDNRGLRSLFIFFREESIAITREILEKILPHLWHCQLAMDFSKYSIQWVAPFTLSILFIDFLCFKFTINKIHIQCYGIILNQWWKGFIMYILKVDLQKPGGKDQDIENIFLLSCYCDRRHMSNFGLFFCGYLASES